MSIDDVDTKWYVGVRGPDGSVDLKHALVVSSDESRKLDAFVQDQDRKKAAARRKLLEIPSYVQPGTVTMVSHEISNAIKVNDWAAADREQEGNVPEAGNHTRILNELKRERAVLSKLEPTMRMVIEYGRVLSDEENSNKNIRPPKKELTPEQTRQELGKFPADQAQQLLEEHFISDWEIKKMKSPDALVNLPLGVHGKAESVPVQDALKSAQSLSMRLLRESQKS